MLLDFSIILITVLMGIDLYTLYGSNDFMNSGMDWLTLSYNSNVWSSRYLCSDPLVIELKNSLRLVKIGDRGRLKISKTGELIRGSKRNDFRVFVKACNDNIELGWLTIFSTTFILKIKDKLFLRIVRKWSVFFDFKQHVELQHCQVDVTHQTVSDFWRLITLLKILVFFNN